MSRNLHAVTRLTLQNFRNHAAFDIACEGEPIILAGPNGAGKTNILEALSLLTPGRGMRRAKFSAMLRQTEEEAAAQWVVSAEVLTREEAHIVGTSFLSQPGMADKRLVRVDGGSLKSQAELAHYCTALWLTPQMEQLFLEARSERRRFLDRLVYGFDAEHASRVASYEHSMRERNRLLFQRKADVTWLSVLEEKMAAGSVAIAVARVEAVERLNRALQERRLFASPLVEVTGDAETLVQEGEGALGIELRLAEELARSRDDDRANGRTGAGAHRTNLFVWHEEHRREAEFCSTGEQKAMLMSILLAQAQAREAWCGSPPLLLLDEVVSHLDREKRKKLSGIARELNAQVWMTGTDAADFDDFRSYAKVVPLGAEADANS